MGTKPAVQSKPLAMPKLSVTAKDCKPRWVLMVNGQNAAKGGITVTSPIHGGARNHPWSSDKTAQGYVINDAHFTLYFVGDTAYDRHFKTIGQQLGTVANQSR